jgi:hypothetical protein
MTTCSNEMVDLSKQYRFIEIDQNENEVFKQTPMSFKNPNQEC